MIHPSLVLVQPKKTCPCLTERLLMGCKKSNQTNKIILHTVDSETFSRILFLQIVLKGIFAMLEIRDSGNERVISLFVRVLFSCNFAFAKFRENKTLTKILEFTVWSMLPENLSSGFLIK